MKMNIKLSKADKVALGAGAVFVYFVGVIPSTIMGGIGYYYRDSIKKFFVQKAVRNQVAKAKTTFSSLFGK